MVLSRKANDQNRTILVIYSNHRPTSFGIITEKIERLDLIIIDDFGMLRLEGQQQNDFEQIIDDRYHKKSLIISSQLPVADWYGVFSNEMLAEACLDRLVHKSLRFELRGDSMRKKY